MDGPKWFKESTSGSGRMINPTRHERLAIAMAAHATSATTPTQEESNNSPTHTPRTIVLILIIFYVLGGLLDNINEVFNILNVFENTNTPFDIIFYGEHYHPAQYPNPTPTRTPYPTYPTPDPTCTKPEFNGYDIVKEGLNNIDLLYIWYVFIIFTNFFRVSTWIFVGCLF